MAKYLAFIQPKIHYVGVNNSDFSIQAEVMAPFHANSALCGENYEQNINTHTHTHTRSAILHDRRLEEEEVWPLSVLTSALERVEWSASRPDRILPAGKEPPVPIVRHITWKLL
jgi:hypothetical protein